MMKMHEIAAEVSSKTKEESAVVTAIYSEGSSCGKMRLKVTTLRAERLSGRKSKVKSSGLQAKDVD